MAVRTRPTTRLVLTAVLAAAILFTVVDGAVYLSIKNTLPGGVHTHCVSDLQTQVNHDSPPGSTFGFDTYGMDPYHRESSWTCSFTGPDSYSGTFLLWTIKGGPCYSVSACPWVLDDYGLSLIRYDGRPEHVYRWP